MQRFVIFSIYICISYILIVADNIKNSKTRRNEKKKLYEIPERKKMQIYEFEMVERNKRNLFGEFD